MIFWCSYFRWWIYSLPHQFVDSKYSFFLPRNRVWHCFHRLRRPLHLIWFSHLHEIVDGLYIHCSLYVYVCVWVCLSVWVSVSEQNSSRTDDPIWTRFSLNGCLLLWLRHNWNWWPWGEGQGHSDVISICSSWFSVNFSTLYLSSFMFDQNEIQCVF